VFVRTILLGLQVEGGDGRREMGPPLFVMLIERYAVVLAAINQLIGFCVDS
jgi:hypothetical protein